MAARLVWNSTQARRCSRTQSCRGSIHSRHFFSCSRPSPRQRSCASARESFNTTCSRRSSRSMSRSTNRRAGRLLRGGRSSIARSCSSSDSSGSGSSTTSSRRTSAGKSRRRSRGARVRRCSTRRKRRRGNTRRFCGRNCPSPCAATHNSGTARRTCTVRGC